MGKGLTRDLDAVAEDIRQRWDADMRSGKLLIALAGGTTRYDPRVTRIRAALRNIPDEPHFYIGQPVEVTKDFVYAEWVDMPLWIAGVRLASPNNPHTITYDVALAWPPGSPGMLTTDFSPDDLQARNDG